ncbi:PAS domain-containing sensor histidine kinase [Nocardioides acrostichi]|uniref:PAS domain-containing sensor histidine kinase n=1 Tax=Nocardioides acrostichi TaxID=2784339 RepID=UPI00188A2237|nr:ATP-binding protein [Nocardioides acrostichi]
MPTRFIDAGPRVEAGAAGLLVLDAAGVIQYVDQAADDLLGERDRIGHAFELPLDTSAPQRIELVDRWGCVRSVSVTVSQVDGAAGGPGGYVVVCRDLVEHDAALEAVRRQVEDDRELSAIAFRELHDSLGGLTWTLDTLQRRWEHLDERERRSQLVRIDQAVGSLAATVAGYLVPDHPVGDQGASTLNALVRERLVDLGEAGAAAVAIAIPDHLRVDAEDAHVWTILRSLLENALVHGCDPVLLVAVERDDEIAVAVVDHGPGIAASGVADLFNRPHSADGRMTLTSGLSTARMLAERYDGSLSYLPHPPGGSRFILTLPAFSGSD